MELTPDQALELLSHVARLAPVPAINHEQAALARRVLAKVIAEWTLTQAVPPRSAGDAPVSQSPPRDTAA